MKRIRLVVSFALLLTAMVIPPAVADAYIGLGASRVDATISLTGGDGGDANGITVYGGKRMGNMGFEIGYTDVGDIDVPGSSIVITGNIIKLQASFSTDVNNPLLLFANAGIAIWDLKNNTGFSDNGTEFAWMLGVNYQFTDRLAFRMDYEQYSDLGGADLDLLTLSLNTRF